MKKISNETVFTDKNHMKTMHYKNIVSESDFRST